ncbi:MAG TPA: hypothetical protein VMN04_02515 [Thermoanaerobaculia bacterium]|nr:hypothetical protein [Thermoanaerobaculia bacterium]
MEAEEKDVEPPAGARELGVRASGEGLGAGGSTSSGREIALAREGERVGHVRQPLPRSVGLTDGGERAPKPLVRGRDAVVKLRADG